MPKKKAREYSHIISLAKARQKRRQNIEGTRGAWYFFLLTVRSSISAKSPGWKCDTPSDLNSGKVHGP
jgi:hypothetical protein